MSASHRSEYNTQDIPKDPGVYVFRDQFKQVIYVGKAKSLRKRISSYFQPSRLKTADAKLRSLINSIEYYELFRSVGIEVPNDETSPICYRSLMESKEFQNSKATIPVILGKDISGKPIIMDLAKAPHLLIAGATGAGKSVFMNTLILSLLFKFSPDEMQMIMVDPKFVELTGYNSLPHLICPVITDPQRVPSALRWAVFEMDCRYQMLATVGVKNLESFNNRVKKPNEPRADDNGNIIPDKLPMTIIIIDELADIITKLNNKRVVNSRE